MSKLLKFMHKEAFNFDASVERYFFHHPYLGYFTALIGIPIFTLGAVTIGTIVIILPLSFLFGWI